MTTTTATTTKRQEYVAKMQKKLEDWNNEIDTLEGRISATTGPAREKLREQLAKARNSYEAGKRKLEEIQAAGESSWEKLSADAEHIWDTMKHSINYFRSQL